MKKYAVILRDSDANACSYQEWLFDSESLQKVTDRARLDRQKYSSEWTVCVIRVDGHGPDAWNPVLFVVEKCGITALEKEWMI